jgi:hypothetical protein
MANLAIGLVFVSSLDAACRDKRATNLASEDALPNLNAVDTAEPPRFAQSCAKVRRTDVVPTDHLIFPILAVTTVIGHPERCVEKATIQWAHSVRLDNIADRSGLLLAVLLLPSGLFQPVQLFTLLGATSLANL